MSNSSNFLRNQTFLANFFTYIYIVLQHQLLPNYFVPNFFWRLAAIKLIENMLSNWEKMNKKSFSKSFALSQTKTKICPRFVTRNFWQCTFKDSLLWYFLERNIILFFFWTCSVTSSTDLFSDPFDGDTWQLSSQKKNQLFKTHIFHSKIFFASSSLAD